VKVVGVALATKPVYGNGQMASRKGEYFRRELSVNNAGGPVWLGVTVTSPGEPTVTGNLFVPRTPEVFTHDLDGNLTSDGRWTYSWDAENRLIRVQSRSDTPQGSWRRVEWQYDALGRRIRQTTWSWLVQSNLWVVTEGLRMVSDPLLFGRHVVDLNGSNNVPVRSYVWGLDLSGTLEGAGGVGGLLWVTLHTTSGLAARTHFCAYDGNGNIVALSAASDGSATARYEYGPFGEPIRMTGPAAPLDPFRFSTKRTCNTTDLVLYEYRVYKPSIGRWANRDPIEEEGGLNLYAYVGNDPVNEFDPLEVLAGAPLPAPPPTLPPPIGTPKPGPPIVTICTVAFCVVYTCTAYACEKTGVHDKLGDLIYKCRNRKSALEKCKDDCYDSYLSDVALCKGLRTKRQREYRYRQAFKLYVDCLKGCEKEHGGR
jgi:RHS repeat-associated protein